MPWYAAKGEIREYLAELNKDGKVDRTNEGRVFFRHGS